MSKLMLIVMLMCSLLAEEAPEAPANAPMAKDAFITVAYRILTPGKPENTVGSLLELHLEIKNISTQSILFMKSSNPLASLTVSLKNRNGNDLRRTEYLDLAQGTLSSVDTVEVKPGGERTINVPLWHLFDHSINGEYAANIAVHYLDPNNAAQILSIPEFKYKLNNPESPKP